MATSAALWLCGSPATLADVWTAKVVGGWTFQAQNAGNSLTDTTMSAALENVRTDDFPASDALANTNAYAKKGTKAPFIATESGGKKWFSVFFTNDFTSSAVYITSVNVRVVCGATTSGYFVVHLSTNRFVTKWWMGTNAVSSYTNSGVKEYPIDADTNFLWNVKSYLTDSTTINNCEFAVVNQTNSLANNLYLGYFQLDVGYTALTNPVVTNDLGAADILTNSATLRGRMVRGGPDPQTWIYWGTNDLAGSPATAGWKFTNYMGPCASGSQFSTNVSGLIANQQYCYKCYATNIYGTNWDATSAIFTTMQARVQFAVTNVGGPEFTSPAQLQVILTSTSGAPVWVDYSVVGGTAGGDDYSPTNGTLLIPAGSTVGNISIGITNDTVYESNETVIVAISNAVGAGLGAYAQCAYTITNDDSPPFVYFTNLTTVNGYQVLENASNVTISVAPAQRSGMPMSVGYGTFDGTASNGVDYAYTNGTFAWAAGDSSIRTFTVAITNNSGQNLDKTFFASLSNAVNCTTNPASTVTVTIIDDDSGPPVVFNDTPGGITSNSATLKGILDSTGGAPTYVWIYWGKTDGISNRLNWATNQYLGMRGRASFSTNVTGLTTNTTYWYRCCASNSNGVVWASISTNFLTGPPTVEFITNSLSGSESNSPVLLGLQLSKPSTYGIDVTVGYSVIGGTASNGTDYLLPASNITIVAGSSYTNISLTVSNDSIYEYDETIVIAISNASNAIFGPTTNCVYTIIDNDQPPAVSFTNTPYTNAPYTVMENETNVTIQVVLSAQAGRTVSVHYATSDGTAKGTPPPPVTGIATYTNTSGYLTWGLGSNLVQMFKVPIIDNTLQDGIKFFRVTLSETNNCTILGNSTTNVTIMEDDNVAPTNYNRGASNVQWTVATLNGFMTTSYPPAKAYICWGPTDGNSNWLAWSNKIDMGSTPGLFSTTIAGLVAGKTYYFRCFATNSAWPASFDWADTTAIFTTLPPWIAGVSNYYVNDGSTNGDLYCSATGRVANTGTATNSPKTSVQDIIGAYALHPGDVVWIDTGHYISSTLTITSDHKGSAASNVVLRGTTSPQGSILDRGGGSGDVISLTAGADYVRFENLGLTGGDNGLHAEGCTGIRVVGCNVYSNNNIAVADPLEAGAGIYLRSCPDPVVSNTLSCNNGNSDYGAGYGIGYGIRIESCTGGTLWGNECFGNWWYGIYVSDTQDPVVTLNICHDQLLADGYGTGYGTGIKIVGSGGGSGETVVSNRCYGNIVNGIDFSGGVSGLVSGNVCWSNVSDGLILNATNLNIVGNVAFTNQGAGLRALALGLGNGSAVIRNNLLHDNSGYQLNLPDSSYIGLIENNTLYGGNGMFLNDPYPGLVTNRNNIIWADGAGNAAICLGRAVANGEMESDYNNLYATGLASVGVGATNDPLVARATLGDWTNAMTLDLHSISADPRFVDSAGADFHLQSPLGSYHSGTWQGDLYYSPCIDAGDPWCGFTNEPDYNGLTVNQGRYGNTPEASRTVYTGQFYSVSLSNTTPAAGWAMIWPPSSPSGYPTNRLITARAAVTNAGYKWEGWKGSLSDTNMQVSFYATGSMLVVASFTQQFFAITATAHPGGNIAPSGQVYVAWGSNQTFTITTNSGYAISNVFVDAAPPVVTNSWTFQNVQTTHTIDVWFAAVESYFAIAATAGVGGAIAPSGVVLVASGSNQTFTITTNFGYAISNVFVDTSPPVVTNSWTFYGVTTSHTILVYFQPLPPMFTSNGTPYSWLQSYHLTNGGYEVADTNDFDRDGAAAWQEYQAGTDPTNILSVFKVLRVQARTGSNNVSWYATTNSGVTNYMHISRSTNLRYASWITWASNIQRSASGTNDWWDTNLPAAGIPVFYRPFLSTNY